MFSSFGLEKGGEEKRRRRGKTGEVP